MELYNNEPTILADWQPRGPYIEESPCASQPMIGTNADGLMAPCLKLTYIQPPTEDNPSPHYP